MNKRVQTQRSNTDQQKERLERSKAELRLKKGAKGITLIALVLTIIVLLILARSSN